MRAQSSRTIPAGGARSALDAGALLSRVRLSGAWRALVLILTAKALVFAVVLYAYASVPFNAERYAANRHYHEPAQYGLATRFTTWDSSHYLFLAEHGYRRHREQANAFAPLLPAAIAGVRLATGDSIMAGLLVANVASAAALIVFFRLVRRRWGEATALGALVLLLAFPTAFYLDLIYSESIFLILAVMTFYWLGEGKPGWAAVAAFFMPLTRFIGVLVAAPFALALLARGRSGEGRLALRGWRPGAELLWALAPVAGALAYLALMALLTGDALAHVHAQDAYPAGFDIGNLLKPRLLLDNLIDVQIADPSKPDSLLERVLFVAFLASAPLVYRRAGGPLLLFYLAAGLVPLLGSFMSYSRFLLLAFPLYIAYAGFFEGRPRALTAVVTVMAAIQALMLAAHTSGYWVA